MHRFCIHIYLCTYIYVHTYFDTYPQIFDDGLQPDSEDWAQESSSEMTKGWAYCNAPKVGMRGLVSLLCMFAYVCMCVCVCVCVCV